MTGVWIFRTSRGETAYQRPDGSYFLQYADGTTKPLSEFEIRRFVSSVADQRAIVDQLIVLEAAIGVKLSDGVRQAIIESAHQAGRRENVLRTGSVTTKIPRKERMTNMKTAKDLKKGDEFQLQICGEVLSIKPVTGGRIKARLELLDTGSFELSKNYVVEFTCSRSRHFNVSDPTELSDFADLAG